MRRRTAVYGLDHRDGPRRRTGSTRRSRAWVTVRPGRRPGYEETFVGPEYEILADLDQRLTQLEPRRDRHMERRGVSTCRSSADRARALTACSSGCGSSWTRNLPDATTRRCPATRVRTGPAGHEHEPHRRLPPVSGVDVWGPRAAPSRAPLKSIARAVGRPRGRSRSTAPRIPRPCRKRGPLHTAYAASRRPRPGPPSSPEAPLGPPQPGSSTGSRAPPGQVRRALGCLADPRPSSA